MKTHEPFEIRVNGKKIECDKPEVTGREVLALAELEPAEDFELLLKITNRELEPVELSETVDLRKEGIETFWARPFKDLEIFVDDEPVTVSECFLTPTQILEKVHKSPESFYLKQILGHREITYKNDPDHLIAIKNHLKFSTCKKEPTPVS
jgi:hypothetical protein